MSSITSVLALPFSLLGISCQDLGQVSCLQEGVYLVDLKQAKCQSFLQQRWISRELWRGAKLATLGLPWWLRWQRIRLQYRRPGFNPWVGKIPWRRGWLPTPVSLSGEFHGQRSLVGYSPRGLKESDTTERLTLYIHKALQLYLPAFVPFPVSIKERCVLEWSVPRMSE